jgi:hypothetical protein
MDGINEMSENNKKQEQKPCQTYEMTITYAVELAKAFLIQQGNVNAKDFQILAVDASRNVIILKRELTNEEIEKLGTK